MFYNLKIKKEIDRFFYFFEATPFEFSAWLRSRNEKGFFFFWVAYRENLFLMKIRFCDSERLSSFQNVGHKYGSSTGKNFLTHKIHEKYYQIFCQN